MTRHIPQYRLHKASGQGRVIIDGRHIYLGAYNTPASREAYDRLIAEWLAAGRQLPLPPNTEANTLTIADMCAAYLPWAAARYTKHGNPTGELQPITLALKKLLATYRTYPATEFGPRQLDAVRHSMIHANWSRKYINQQIGRIRRIFRWSHLHLGIPIEIVQSLSIVEALKPGEFSVRETAKIQDVPLDIVRQTQKHIAPHIADMIELQLLTAMRPGEVCIMRVCDIDMTQNPWAYIPHRHKLEHHSIDRTILIGQAAQEIVKKYLAGPPESYLFAPRKANSTASTIAPCYNCATYGRAVARACDRAFPPTDRLARRDGETKKKWLSRLKAEHRITALRAWQSQHRWYPGQLRHTAATRIFEGYGIEVAAAVLGHAHISQTEVYTHAQQRMAARAINKIG